MINISYRTRHALRRSILLVVTIGAVAIGVALCLILWLQRFVVYTDYGVTLDFDRSFSGESQLPQQGQSATDVTIVYDDTPYQSPLQQLNGYYISQEDLMDDPEAVQARLEQLPAGTPVLLDIKAYRGYFFYTTQAGEHTSGLYDLDKMDALIQWLGQSDLYVIARMSTLRDFVTVWDHSSYGLTTASGTLYSDRGDYGLGYWLDPTNASVQAYLISILEELKSLGFDEVVLDDFRYPDSDGLSISGDPAENILQCAQALVDACAEDGFAISFCSDDADFVLPEGRCRLYLKNVAAESAQQAWNRANISEKRRYLVFIAEENDSRYNIENGILSPLP